VIGRSITRSPSIACCYAALAGLAERAGSGVSPEEAAKVAAKAMEFLCKSVGNRLRNPNELCIESALDLLRDRFDFKKLVAELGNNPPALQEKK
jgi:hypothetical protein